MLAEVEFGVEDNMRTKTYSKIFNSIDQYNKLNRDGESKWSDGSLISLLDFKDGIIEKDEDLSFHGGTYIIHKKLSLTPIV